jgi:hypothetical protein
MVNYVGYKGPKSAARVDKEAVEGALKRMAVENLYVYYTGGSYRARSKSGRTLALRTIHEKLKPVPLAEVIRRAATASDGKGFDPAFVRAGLFLHQGAKPCVYMALEKRADGAFVAAKAIPTPDEALFSKGFKPDDVVIPVGGKLKAIAAPAPKKEVKPAKKKAAKKEATHATA